MFVGETDASFLELEALDLKTLLTPLRTPFDDFLKYRKKRAALTDVCSGGDILETVKIKIEDAGGHDSC